MRSIILFCLVLVSCAENYPCEYYVAGMCVSDLTHSMSPAQIERVVEIVEKKANQRFDWVINLPYALEGENTHLIFTAEPYARGCEETTADGVYICERWINGYNVWDGENTEIRVAAQTPGSCRALTTLGHELLHSIERIYMLPRPNGEPHDYPNFFYDHYGINSLEWEIDIETLKLCQE